MHYFDLVMSVSSTYEMGPGYGKEWESSHRNGMEMGISHNIGSWEWEGMGTDCMGEGRSGNQKTHYRSSLLCDLMTLTSELLTSNMFRQLPTDFELAERFHFDVSAVT